MVCQTCQNMLYSHKYPIASRSHLELRFWHHHSLRNLQQSANQAGCYICRVLFEHLRNHTAEPVDSNTDSGVPAKQWLVASLRCMRGRPGIYRLDFSALKVRGVIASFVLKQVDSQASDTLVEAWPVSTSTDAPEVFALAKQWLEDCITNHEICRVVRPRSLWYPNRLIGIGSILESSSEAQKVRLVSRKIDERLAEQAPFDGDYLTLSHCWGDARFLKLTLENRSTLQQSINLTDLPLTFQHAIRVAHALGIQWIWIDALCIIQQDEADWLEESALMYKIYTNSYCNISATAAEDSSKGLFHDRDKAHAWFDHVRLWTKDLVKDSQSRVRCSILDLSFWTDYVQNAPVNRRSWVLQERLLAPRVLHWCRDQIAFECRQTDCAECRPEGIPHFQISRGELVDGARLKALDTDLGTRLREIRLAPRRSSSSSSKSETPNKLQSMVAETHVQFSLYELWKRIVEEYSKMELSVHRDRLIALSGIARMMVAEMRKHDVSDTYVAGMWKNYLASELLWYVNEGRDGVRQPFVNTRPKDYRAPSFSWAAVETKRGITYGETTNHGLLIEVEDVQLTHRPVNDTFGLVTEGLLQVKGSPRDIEMYDARISSPSVTDSGSDLVATGTSSYLQIVVDLSISFVTFMLTFIHSWLQSGGSLSFLKQRLSSHLTNLTTMNRLQPIATEQPPSATQSPSNPSPDSKSSPITTDPEDIWTNRFSWRIISNGVPISESFSVVWLDSPASEPSIFGPDGKMVYLPVLHNEDHLICLLLQGGYGKDGNECGEGEKYSYKRVGLTRILKLHEEVDALIEDATGRGKEDGREARSITII